MSDYATKATSILEVNGTQAKEELSRLKKHAEDVREALMQAWKTGDTTAQKGLQKELNKTEKQIRKIQSETVNVEQVLKRLDKATPKELQQTLRRLEKDLKNIERGSSAWDEQTRKIKAVRTELAKIKAETKEQSNLWERFAKKMFDWGAALQTVMATVTGLTMTARQAVQAYAAMDAEMASVRKFTGMTADEVERMNEEFKKIDTRTSRENLNKLAQEAGRLGMQSQEDVLGFVRAADQINVALDDLGDGATLTLSKLTDIFGDKQRLGVEQSLLSVGSVINELSQNCTASAPYLAEFASRMGGVGAQAGMSIQQIMAFGAVLDSNNQKVEASSTALSQVITRLYQDPAKYARVAGLDVQKFAELMRTDANEAVLTLLDALNKAGGMDTLSPMFKDMGETGARAISALSTLAKHVDDVRRQQLVANQAFSEATSVTKEFNVQNNTVQAGLDKAKKAFNEMAVQLGEKLAPAMKYAITSGSALMKGLSVTVDFLFKYMGAILALTASWVAYTVAVNASNIAFKAHYYWLILTEGAQKLLGTATLALKVAFFAVTGQINKAKAAYTAFHLLTKTTPWGIIIAAVTALGVGIYQLAKHTDAATKAQRALNEIQTEAKKKAAEQMQQVNLLMAAAKNMNLTYDEQNAAVAKLNKIIPGFNGKINAQTRAFSYSEQALKNYNDQLVRLYELEGAKEKLKDLGKQKADLVIRRNEQQKAINDEKERQRKQYAQMSGNPNYSTSQGGSMPAVANISATNATMLRGMQGDLDDINSEIKDVDRQMNAINNAYGNDMQRQAVKQPVVPESDITGGGGVGTVGGGGASGGGHGGGDSGTEDKFKAEKDWREQQIALAKIAWLKGETDYEQHTDRMEQIEVEYYDKILARADLSEQERLEAQGKSLEAQKKQKETAHDRTIEQENQQYAELQAVVQNDYLQGRISRQAYDMQMENIEFAHLRAMTEITKEGTDERAKVEAAYRQKLVAEQQKRQKKYADDEKLHQEELKKIKEDYFGPNAAENKALYDAALQNLQQVYDAELRAAGDNAKEKLRIEKAFLAAKAALRKQFNQDDQAENMNFLQAWGQSVNEWLESDMGKAVTGTLETVTNSMSSLFQQMSSLIQAEADIQIAAIERRYDTEISRAEGNQNKVKALERRKEQETAKIKNQAARRQMSMQVIQAIAQTATAALNAYSSAAAIPVVGYILAPIAASMAVAAGMMQVAAIKKQQQAQEAQGYATGGFTPDGPADKPVGIVHAGEWVASQKLLRNPATRPAIEALDYAQRHNTMGSIRAADVSRSVTASQVVARTTADDTAMTAMAAAMARYADTMRDLGDRLNEPFVTVNTIEGDTGIKQAQDEYQRLMNNTLPKNRRK